MINTIIERADGIIISHTGDVGITLTGRRDGDGLDALFEVGEDVPSDELVALLGTFITFIEEKFGERFVSQIMAHYASETGKKYLEEGDNKMFIIRGRKR